MNDDTVTVDTLLVARDVLLEFVYRGISVTIPFDVMCICLEVAPHVLRYALRYIESKKIIHVTEDFKYIEVTEYGEKKITEELKQALILVLNRS